MVDALDAAGNAILHGLANFTPKEDLDQGHLAAKPGREEKG